MSTDPTISIIVAVYNAEKYLKRCIDSLLAQTFTDYEVLLINDGSTDHSGAMCDEYAACDSRFRVFHQHNQGVGATRRVGIEQARGEYTVHIDPDDWVDNTFLQMLYGIATAEDADMVICDFMMEYDGYSKRSVQCPSQCTPYSLTSDILSLKLHGGCCNKLIKRDCYHLYGINFIAGLNWGEDMVTVLRILRNPIRIAYCPGAMYHYDCHSNGNSYTRIVTPTHLEQREKYVRLLMDFITDHSLKIYVYSRLLTVAYLAIFLDTYTAEEFHRRYDILKGHSFTGCSLSKQERMFVWIALHIGYPVARALMKVKLFYRRLFKRA